MNGCRIEGGERRLIVNSGLPDPRGEGFGGKYGSSAEGNTSAGRWPANVVLDPEAAAVLDEQTGERPGAVSNSRSGVQGAAFGKFEAMPQAPGYGDTGGASRFFYVAKADGAERHAGLGDSGATLFTPHACACETTPTASEPSRSAGATCASCGGVIGGARRNDHPT